MKERKVERGREESQSPEGDVCSDDDASSSDDELGRNSYMRSDYLKRDSGEASEESEQAGDSYTKSD